MSTLLSTLIRSSVIIMKYVNVHHQFPHLVPYMAMFRVQLTRLRGRGPFDGFSAKKSIKLKAFPIFIGARLIFYGLCKICRKRERERERERERVVTCETCGGVMPVREEAVKWKTCGNQCVECRRRGRIGSLIK